MSDANNENIVVTVTDLDPSEQQPRAEIEPDPGGKGQKRKREVKLSYLLEWNIEKIGTLTMDNASANDVIARCLQDHYSSRRMLLCRGEHL
ncbi:hypothetical protein RJ641_015283 [Dillenia turbinata]|uniref:Uncharacterized protein n=1 Tax=Dillenia turbinata TaxID=194707 RepID=A0AAN8YY25_9MAGN